STTYPLSLHDALPICGGCAGVPESLNRDRRATKRNLLKLARFLDHVEQSARRGFAAPLGAADRNRLAGNHSMRGMTHRHGIGIRSEEHTSELQSPCNL